MNDELKLQFKIPPGLETDEDLVNGMKLASTVIGVIAKYQPVSDSHGPFIGGLMGALAGAAIGVLGKDATVAMLEQMVIAARAAEARVEEAAPDASKTPPNRNLH